MRSYLKTTQRRRTRAGWWHCRWRVDTTPIAIAKGPWIPDELLPAAEGPPPAASLSPAANPAKIAVRSEEELQSDLAALGQTEKGVRASLGRGLVRLAARKRRDGFAAALFPPPAPARGEEGEGKEESEREKKQAADEFREFFNRAFEVMKGGSKAQDGEHRVTGMLVRDWERVTAGRKVLTTRKVEEREGGLLDDEVEWLVRNALNGLDRRECVRSLGFTLRVLEHLDDAPDYEDAETQGIGSEDPIPGEQPGNPPAHESPNQSTDPPVELGQNSGVDSAPKHPHHSDDSTPDNGLPTPEPTPDPPQPPARSPIPKDDGTNEAPEGQEIDHVDRRATRRPRSWAGEDLSRVTWRGPLA